MLLIDLLEYLIGANNNRLLSGIGAVPDLEHHVDPRVLSTGPLHSH